jgi:hypothetical protein
LESPHVLSHLEDTEKKQPLYMVTGYMYVEGAKLSRAKNKSTQAGMEASATDPNTGSSAGGKTEYTGGDSSSSGFDGSTPFILGLRVRKIWWNKEKTRQMSDKVAGATLSDRVDAKEEVLTGAEFVDDATVEGEEVDITEETLGIDPSLWVFPSGH